MTFRQRMKELAIRAGVNRAIVYAVITYTWSIISGPLSVFLIITLMTPDEQGYYYTFYGVIALANTLELGAGSVFQLMAGHLWANLGLDEAGIIRGDDLEKRKLSEVLRIAYKWFLLVGLCAFPMVALGGLIFFGSRTGAPLEAPSAWLALCAAGLANFLLTPALYILDGCGQLHMTSKYRLFQAGAASVMTWLAIWAGAGLWAPAMSTGLAFIMMMALLAFRYSGFFLQLIKIERAGLVSWRSHILPLQWRLAVSVAGNYFTMSFITPVVFHFCGPAAAGQIGIAGTITAAIINIPLNWVRCRIPEFSWHIARKQFVELDALFSKAFWQMASVSGGLLVPLGLLIAALVYLDHPWLQRLPPPLTLSLFIIAALFQTPVAAMACYLRTYRHEPYMRLTLASGLAYAALIPLAAKYSGISAVAGASALISAAALLPASSIFFRRREKWQKS